ncbi:MAG TPA: NAD(P)-binding domain-containing protein, partial [Urbifossiella sp.]
MADAKFPVSVGFLGAGQMASALAAGWSRAGLLDISRSLAADPFAGSREKFTQITGIRAVPGNREVVEACDVVVLAVKPQVMAAVLAEIRPMLAARHLVISIAAGITLQSLENALGSGARLVRVMPNTPCLVNASAAGFAAGKAAT